MNRWEGKGGLTRDPEVAFLEGSGICMWKASIAVNGARYDSQTRQQGVTTVYVSLVAFGWLAEQIAEYNLTRGDEVYVIGELEQREIDKDGKKERKTGVLVNVLNPTRVRHGARAQTSGQRQAEEPPDDPWGPAR